MHRTHPRELVLIGCLFFTMFYTVFFFSPFLIFSAPFFPLISSTPHFFHSLFLSFVLFLSPHFFCTIAFTPFLLFSSSALFLLLCSFHYFFTPFLFFQVFRLFQFHDEGMFFS